MDRSEDEIWNALYETYELADSESKTAILEELLAVADAKNLDSAAFSIRLEIVQSTVFSGDIQKALVAFTHCVAEFDAEKDYALAESFSVLWSAKWINRTVIAFPSISKEQVNDIEKDIGDRFLRHGFGLRAHYMFGWLNATEMGDTSKANALREKWVNEATLPAHPRCQACELHYEVLYQIESDNIEKGLHDYRVLLRSGEVCNRVPLASHVLALPFLDTQGAESKTAFNFASFEFEPAHIDRVSLAGEFLFYLLSIDGQESALKIVSNYLGYAIKTKELDQKLNFLVAAECFLNVNTHFTYPWTYLDRVFDAQQLKDFLKTEVNSLSSAFDARNQNDFVSGKVAAKRSLYKVE